MLAARLLLATTTTPTRHGRTRRRALVDALVDLCASDTSYYSSAMCASLVLVGLGIGFYRPSIGRTCVAFPVSAMGLALADTLGLPTRYEVPFGLALAALVASHVRYGIIVLYWTMFSSAALCVVASSWPAVALPPTLLLDGIALVVGAGVTVWSEVHLDRNDKRIDNAVAIPLATALIVMSLDACVGLFSWAVQCIAGFCLGAVFLSHMLLEWEDRKRHATTACSSTAQVSTKADQTNETERADTTDVADERPKAD